VAGAVRSGRAEAARAIGIHVAIRTATGSSGAIVKDVLGEWTGRPAYLAALVAGAARFGLDGEPDGAVTQGQAERAAAKLAQHASAAATEGASEPASSS
jgi:sRNA-binding protein